MNAPPTLPGRRGPRDFQVCDLLRVEVGCPSRLAAGSQCHVVGDYGAGLLLLRGIEDGWAPDRFSLIQDADGWRPWGGGENPAPGEEVEVWLRDGHKTVGDARGSEEKRWDRSDPSFSAYDIVAYRIIPTPKTETPPKVDRSAIKAGDFVTVRVKVRELSDVTGCFWIDAPGDNRSAKGSYRLLSPSDILSHEPARPKPIEVGETVKAEGYAGSYRLVAIDEGWAWLKDNDGFHRIQVPVSDLTRAS